MLREFYCFLFLFVPLLQYLPPFILGHPHDRMSLFELFHPAGNLASLGSFRRIYYVFGTGSSCYMRVKWLKNTLKMELLLRQVHYSHLKPLLNNRASPFLSILYLGAAYFLLHFVKIRLSWIRWEVQRLRVANHDAVDFINATLEP